MGYTYTANHLEGVIKTLLNDIIQEEIKNETEISSFEISEEFIEEAKIALLDTRVRQGKELFRVRDSQGRLFSVTYNKPNLVEFNFAGVGPTTLHSMSLNLQFGQTIFELLQENNLRIVGW